MNYTIITKNELIEKMKYLCNETSRARTGVVDKVSCAQLCTQPLQKGFNLLVYNRHRDGQFYIIYESRQSKVMDYSHVKMKTFKI